MQEGLIQVTIVRHNGHELRVNGLYLVQCNTPNPLRLIAFTRASLASAGSGSGAISRLIISFAAVNAMLGA